MNEPAGQVALVTGAAQGLGHAAALRLAADGFNVFVGLREGEKPAALEKEIESAGGSVYVP